MRKMQATGWGKKCIVVYFSLGVISCLLYISRSFDCLSTNATRWLVPRMENDDRNSYNISSQSRRPTLDGGNSVKASSLNIIRYAGKADLPFSNIHISPPLEKDEKLSNINFNIERWFTFGSVSENKANIIPKRIHFMWNNETVPDQFVDNLKTFPINNPGWEFYFWTLPMGRKLIQQRHPWLLTIYDNYGQDVMRADVLRYIVVYHFGGAYFDLDMKSIKPLDAIMKGEQCMVSPEPMEHAVFVIGTRSLLSNPVFLCTPRHEFFKVLIDRLQDTKSNKNEFYATGPQYFTDTFNHYISNASYHSHNTKSETIHVMPYSVFLDRVKPNVHVLMSKECRKSSVPTGSTLMRTQACQKWKARGEDKRNLSSIAVTDHGYYGTYGRPKSIKYSPENHIKKIISHVKLDPQYV